MNTAKDGFIRFPHKLYDAILRQRLSISQEKALLYIIRKTVGFNKRSDRISISRMASVTGFERRTMINAVHDLEKMGIIRLGQIRPGKATEMELLTPDYWDQPVNVHSHVNADSHVNGDSHKPVNVDSHPPVNADSQVPVNVHSHTKETIYRNTIKENKKKDEILPVEEEDDDGLDPAVVLEMLRRERDGNLSVQ